MRQRAGLRSSLLTTEKKRRPPLFVAHECAVNYISLNEIQFYYKLDYAVCIYDSNVLYI